MNLKTVIRLIAELIRLFPRITFKIARNVSGLILFLYLPSLTFVAPTQAITPIYLLGGEASVKNSDRNAFSLPSRNLSINKRDQFFIGNAFFTKPWVSAPASTTARDGLGPVFITNTCQSCHVKDGRGRPPITEDEPFRSILVRLSVEGTQSPDPVYGDQIQNRSVNGVKPEAQPQIKYHYMKGQFSDGTDYELRQPILKINSWAQGPPKDTLLMSLRVAPSMIGLGLLEAIDESTLLKFADPQDTNNDGISGKPNYVQQTGNNKPVIGRFGWKAEQASVKQQVAAAFNGDMGLTTSLFPKQPCTTQQKDCLNSPAGGNPEVTDEILEAVNFYAHHLAVPVRRNINDNEVLLGEQLFNQAQCSSCHMTYIKTGSLKGFPELSNQLIHPFTDLLLHDMGIGLADNRPSFEATGQEWRTPPLWGIGLVETVNKHSFFLHDGRARSLLEAILWHGGEAENSRLSVENMSQKERNALIKYLNSL